MSATIEEAAILLADATHERQTMHVRGHRALRFYRLFHNRHYRYFCQAVAVANLALALFEAPVSSRLPAFYYLPSLSSVVLTSRVRSLSTPTAGPPPTATTSSP